MKHFVLIFTLFTFLISGKLLANQQAELLLHDPDYSQVELSPDGDHLALLRKNGENHELLIVRSDTLKAVNNILFPESEQITKLVWANNKRLILALKSQFFSKHHHKNRDDFDRQINKKLSMKVYKAHDLRRKKTDVSLYAIDRDQQQGEFIFGKRAVQKKGQEWNEVSKEKQRIHGARINQHFFPMLSEKKHILVTTSDYDRNNYLYKVNIYDKSVEQLSELSVRPSQLKYFDTDKQLWMQSFNRESKQNELFQFNFESNDWNRFVLKNASRNLQIINYDKRNNQLVVKDYCDNNTLSFCYFKSDSSALVPFNSHLNYGVENLYADPEGSPLGFSFLGEYPQYQLNAQAQNSTKALADILNYFKGLKVEFAFAKSSNKTALIKATSDIHSPQWYLFREDAKEQLRPIVAMQKVPFELNPTYSFQFDTQDGVTIQSYATFPKLAKGQLPPMVVLVNSNVLNGRQSWHFDPEVQFLAASGFAVLQVNHRGNLGFGEAFKNLGRPFHRETIQEDIIEAVNFLADNKQIDPKRVCIMGKEFGGQSAYKASLLAPKVFKCVISDSANYQHSDNEQRNQYSLVNRVEELKAPILVMYGEKGKQKREAIQAEQLIAALKKAKRPFEVYQRAADDYYLNQQENRILHYQKITEFLNKHLKIESQP